MIVAVFLYFFFFYFFLVRKIRVTFLLIGENFSEIGRVDLFGSIHTFFSFNFAIEILFISFF